MSSTNWAVLIPFQPVLCFSCLIVLTRLSITRLNRNQRENPGLGSNLRECIQSFTIKDDISYRAVLDILYHIQVPNISSLIFYYEWILNFVICFYCSNWYEHLFSLLQSLNMGGYIDQFVNLDKSYILGINPAWS